MERNPCQQFGGSGDMQQHLRMPGWEHRERQSTQHSVHSPLDLSPAMMDPDRYGSAFCDTGESHLHQQQLGPHNSNPHSHHAWPFTMGPSYSMGGFKHSAIPGSSHSTSTHASDGTAGNSSSSSSGDGGGSGSSGCDKRNVAGTTARQHATAMATPAQHQHQHQAVEAAGFMDAMIDPSVDMSCFSFHHHQQRLQRHPIHQREDVHHQQIGPQPQPGESEEEAAHVQYRLQHMTIASTPAPAAAHSTAATHAEQWQPQHHQAQHCQPHAHAGQQQPQQSQQASGPGCAPQTREDERVIWDDSGMRCVEDEAADEERELTALMDQTRLAPTGHSFQMPYIS